MATVLEELQRLKQLVHSGKGSETIHVVFTDREAKARKENKGPKPKTRFMVETHSPEGYAALNVQKDRYFRILKNPVIVADIMARALSMVGDAQLQAWLDEGHHEPPPEEGDEENEY